MIYLGAGEACAPLKAIKGYCGEMAPPRPNASGQTRADEAETGQPRLCLRNPRRRTINCSTR
jgi:hypothetical protein